MYIKYKDYKGKLADGDIVLMSHQEFVDGGKSLKGMPITVTPEGKEPPETESEE